MSNIAAQFAAGKKFRVIREGARLHGWTHHPGYHTGTAIDLKVGDVIESLGYGPGIGSDPGYGIHWKGDAAYLQFSPSTGGAWAYHPAEGWVEEVVE